jgi:hypothetical protein
VRNNGRQANVTYRSRLACGVAGLFMEQDLGGQREDELPISAKMNRHTSVDPAGTNFALESMGV